MLTMLNDEDANDDLLGAGAFAAVTFILYSSLPFPRCHCLQVMGRRTSPASVVVKPNDGPALTVAHDHLLIR